MHMGRESPPLCSSLSVSPKSIAYWVLSSLFHSHHLGCWSQRAVLLPSSHRFFGSERGSRITRTCHEAGQNIDCFAFYLWRWVSTNDLDHLLIKHCSSLCCWTCVPWSRIDIRVHSPDVCDTPCIHFIWVPPLDHAWSGWNHCRTSTTKTTI